MEYRISDLLDDLTEVEAPIQIHAAVSENRIKELTMKKVHSTPKYSRPRRYSVGKFILIAALIAALAVPALAASGLLFSDWNLDSPDTTLSGYDHSGYDHDRMVGSGSKTWDVSGWNLTISAEDSSPTGLTFVCQEPGYSEVSGTLATSEGYWLEKWDGNSYLPTGQKHTNGAPIEIHTEETARWEIRWDTPLEAGSYRIGKTFTYTSEDGTTQDVELFAKFRLFNEDMAPYITQVKDAMADFLEQDSYHFTYTFYKERPDWDYAYYVSDVWKSGNDYLESIRYVKEDGSLSSARGYLLRDGIGYALNWKNGDATTPVTAWKQADYLGQDNFDLHFTAFDVYDAFVGQVAVEGNTIAVMKGPAPQGRPTPELTPEEIQELRKQCPTWGYNYHETAYTMDSGGNLAQMRYTRRESLDPESTEFFLDYALDVRHTDPQEIARLIESQDVTSPPAFSWAEDQETYASKLVMEGFQNTTTHTIQSSDQVVDIARAEADPTKNPLYLESQQSPYNIAKVFYDESARVWKVEFSFSSNDDFRFLVYLDEHGTTIATAHPFPLK